MRVTPRLTIGNDDPSKTYRVMLCDAHTADRRFGIPLPPLDIPREGECDACTDDQERAAIQSEGA